MSDSSSTARTVQIAAAVLWGLLLVVQLSVFGVGAVAEVSAEGPHPTFQALLSIVAGVVGGMSLATFFGTRWVVRQSFPDKPVFVIFWIVGQLVSWALAEAVGFYGLVLRFAGGSVVVQSLFVAGSLILLLLEFPRLPRKPAAP